MKTRIHSAKKLFLVCLLVMTLIIISPASASVVNASGVDTDQDGITDDGEIAIGTDPNNPDTDGDTIWDGDELFAGTDPLDSDTDDDGISDADDITTQDFDITPPGVNSSFKLGYAERMQHGGIFPEGLPVSHSENFSEVFLPNFRDTLVNAVSNSIAAHSSEIGDRLVIGAFLSWSYPDNLRIVLVMDDFEVLTFIEDGIPLLQPEEFYILRADLGSTFKGEAGDIEDKYVHLTASGIEPPLGLEVSTKFDLTVDSTTEISTLSMKGTGNLLLWSIKLDPPGGTFWGKVKEALSHALSKYAQYLFPLVDFMNPEIKILSPDYEFTKNNRVVLSCNITEKGGILPSGIKRVEQTLQPKGWVGGSIREWQAWESHNQFQESTTLILEDGKYVYEVKASDWVGLWATPGTKVFTVDTVKPTWSRWVFKNGKFELTVQDTGSGLATIKVNWVVNCTVSPTGDMGGTTSPVTVTVTKDRPVQAGEFLADSYRHGGQLCQR